MKKFIYTCLTLGALASLASCASEEPAVKDNDGTVTFTVGLPSNYTRAYGDTPECNQLTMTVYDEEDTMVISDSTINAFGPGATEQDVSIQLVKNQTYRVVFYANNKDSHFATYSRGMLEVNYDSLTVNSEKDDAFFRSYQFTVDGTQKEVKLYRPFAQVNIGTDDLEATSVQHIIANLKTKLSVTKGLYTKMNLKDSTLVADSQVAEAVDFENATPASVNTDFPVEGYSNLLSVYLLVPTDRDIINASCTMANNTSPINTIPLDGTNVQLNHRTNIYGRLLTSRQDFNIIIEPAFNEDPYTYPVTEVKSVDDFVKALTDGNPGVIVTPEDYVMDISNAGRIDVTSNKIINNNGTILNDGNGQIRSTGPGVTVEINGGELKTTDNALFLILASNESNMNLNNVKCTATKKTDGAILALMGGTINIKNSVVDVNFCAVQSWNAGESYLNSHLNAENCTFISRSKNTDGPWTYCVNMNGDNNDATLTNCTILGIQGAVAANDNAKITLNNCVAATFVPEGATALVTFYPVWTANGGVVNINSGYYYSESPSTYNVYQDANGTINMTGGFYNLTPYNSTSNDLLAPASGFTYKTVSETKTIPTPWGGEITATFDREVVAE